ncbi:hypothetical protein N9D35_05345 [Gammaproteobacteria bacterium]|nr:hypothetical protein [Gammaproteobacteria bacterium]
MEKLTKRAIGGFLELELPSYNLAEWINRSYKYKTARGALLSLIRQVGISKIRLPRYICGSLLNAIRSLNIDIGFYDINSDFTVKKFCVKRDEFILYINYFGICDVQGSNIISEYGSNHVIIDNSQSLFSPPLSALATIYSPRKFFGLPDGGLLYTEVSEFNGPTLRDKSSLLRLGHLFSRAADTKDDFYSDYKTAESSLELQPELGMSDITELLLQSVDFQKARRVRIKNFEYLHDKLGGDNRLGDLLGFMHAPLCYPFLPCKGFSNRERLIEAGVYTPRYWLEALDFVRSDSFEAALIKDCLFLPCDQRYDFEDMERIVNSLVLN